MHRRVLLFSIIVIAVTPIARAGAPSATAVLINSDAAVGQTVQMQIKVTDASNVTAPEEISVDGLVIHRAGQQYESHSSLGFGGIENSSSITYIYTILPLRSGKFKIPAQTISAGGSALRTEELTLEVGESSNRQSTTRNRSTTLDPRDLASAELIIPKKNVYVGELVPVEIRVRIDGRVRFDGNSVLAGPQLSGQGFTVQKAERPVEKQETINGRRFNVFVYKTAIAAAKAGSLEVGPARLETLMQWPRPRSRQYSPRDIFGMDDGFDSIMPNPFADLTQPVPVKMASEPVTLDVKTLPPNAPPSFSGAIGNFTMTSEANPKSGQVGDPFTVTAKISGRGNFDRVTAPAFEDERGWRKYPPSASFTKDDDVGISGAKTFETVLSPNERKDKIPGQLFTYFDSLKEQYVTLRGDPIPIHVEGGVAPSTTPAPPSTNAPVTTASRAPAPKQQDILYQLTELPPKPQSFTALFARRSFWLAQLLPLLALLAYVASKIRQAHRDNREAQRREALQREAAELHRSLHRDDASPQEYFSRASRAVQLKTALAKNLDPNMVDAEIAASAFKADEATRLRLRRLFEKSDEVRYSGTRTNGIRLLPPETRKEVLDLVDNLRA